MDVTGIAPALISRSSRGFCRRLDDGDGVAGDADHESPD